METLARIRWGNPALGLPPRAGFDVGLAIVLEKGEDPVDALESR
jgi:hypothetical protein